jgi:hypothetical protein
MLGAAFVLFFAASFMLGVVAIFLTVRDSRRRRAQESSLGFGLHGIHRRVGLARGKWTAAAAGLGGFGGAGLAVAGADDSLWGDPLVTEDFAGASSRDGWLGEGGRGEWGGEEPAVLNEFFGAFESRDDSVESMDQDPFDPMGWAGFDDIGGSGSVWD